MTGPSLDALIDDTDAQLAAALEAVGNGGSVDLSDLPPRIETICRLAVANHDKPAAHRLVALHGRLEALETLLRAYLAGGATSPDSLADRRRAAERYRSAGAVSPGDRPPADEAAKDMTD